ncbi:helix-turn-helix domain-containing protein [Fulvivirgaceae bacterium PWU5]|uniref:Helix-turn-helix domain-containing protein n=1 Tax=Dawidia cretensis TaxID=2782350 RepID=A0AAP2E4E2_9BACT|nr:helix-turn-helix transcriptional regulator [Dawidia cretensis]MBT1712390.1 helix-turn-helix domain-containing protein [Dawidia cretensis]
MAAKNDIVKHNKQPFLSEEHILEDFKTSVGSVIIRLRKTKGYSSHESFAQEYDLPRMQYWRVERGKTNLTVRTLAKLLHIHQLTMIAFMLLVIEERKAGNPNYNKKQGRKANQCKTP